MLAENPKVIVTLHYKKKKQKKKKKNSFQLKIYNKKQKRRNIQKFVRTYRCLNVKWKKGC